MTAFDFMFISAKCGGLIMLLLLMFQLKKDLKRALREKARRGGESHV